MIKSLAILNRSTETCVRVFEMAKYVDNQMQFPWNVFSMIVRYVCRFLFYYVFLVIYLKSLIVIIFFFHAGQQDSRSMSRPYKLSFVIKLGRDPLFLYFQFFSVRTNRVHTHIIQTKLSYLGKAVRSVLSQRAHINMFSTLICHLL